MASGVVQFIGSQIGTSGSFGSNGNTIAKTIDGDFTTYWDAPNASGDWVGVDLGSGNGAALTDVIIAPKASDRVTGNHEHKLVGGKIQASDDATFATGVVDLLTITGTATGDYPYGPFPYLPRYEFSALGATSSGTAYRAYRYRSNTGFGAVAEIQFRGAPTTGNSKPCTPVISPTGGRYASGDATVTITSATTSAAIYYTTDGSTPTTASTLYSGAFTLTPTAAGVVVKAIAHDATCSTATSDTASGTFLRAGFQPNTDWRDDNGILIEAHSGHILYHGGFYWWYGTTMNKSQAGTVGDDAISGHGIWLYRSADLMRWTRIGNILDNGPSAWKYVLRPHVLYNSSTGKFVLWAHCYTAAGPDDRAGVATADAPEGPWEWVTDTLDPDGNGYKDCTLFQDDDGTAYTIYTRGDQDFMNISRLASDYLTSEEVVYTTSVTGNREAPCMFKRNGKYVWITSVGNYYDPNSTFNNRYQVSDAIDSGWVDWGSAALLFEADPVGTDFAIQPTHVLQVHGKSDGWLLVGDRWGYDAANAKKELYRSRYNFLPLTFPTEETVVARRHADWTLGFFAARRKTVRMVSSGNTYAVGVG